MLKNARKRQQQKANSRLKSQIRDTDAEPQQTGIYSGYVATNPYGRQHRVTVDGVGEVFGEMITPSAISVGQSVAIYYGKDCLFDAL